MELLPNIWAIALTLLPFALTAWALYAILFKPMLAYLDARLAAIEGERRKAAELEERVTVRMAEYEQRLNAARAEVADLRAARREEAMTTYNHAIAEARAKAEAGVAAAMAELATEREAARLRLQDTARALGAQITVAVLGRDAVNG